jgi:hypothetical protein
MRDTNNNHDVGKVTDALNTMGGSNETLFADRVETEKVAAAITRTEYDALGAPARAYLNDVVLAAPWVQTGSANMRANLGTLFAAGTQTRTALTAIASRSAARSEMLFGSGYLVTPDQVEQSFFAIGWR